MTWKTKEEIDISVFDVFNRIAKEKKIKAKDWAEAGGVQIARISELRRLSNFRRRGIKEPIGRRLTLDKAEALMNGLIKILGSEAPEQLLNKLDDMKDPNDRILYMTIAALNSGIDNEPLSLFLKAHLGAKRKSH